MPTASSAFNPTILEPKPIVESIFQSQLSAPQQLEQLPSTMSLQQQLQRLQQQLQQQQQQELQFQSSGLWGLMTTTSFTESKPMNINMDTMLMPGDGSNTDGSSQQQQQQWKKPRLESSNFQLGNSSEAITTATIKKFSTP
jgi:hypothetical protein